MCELDIEKLALLARIKLDEREKDKLQKDFEGILNYVSQLDQVDVGSVESDEIGNVIGLKNVTREDVCDPHKSGEFTEILLKEAPAVEGGFVKVKDILNK